eukprot:4285949-Pyramimonas_sp.AAC.1
MSTSPAVVTERLTSCIARSNCDLDLLGGGCGKNCRTYLCAVRRCGMPGWPFVASCGSGRAAPGPCRWGPTRAAAALAPRSASAALPARLRLCLAWSWCCPW